MSCSVTQLPHTVSVHTLLHYNHFHIIGLILDLTHFLCVCLFIHSEWLFNCHSVLHHLTHLLGVKFSLIAVIACARAYDIFCLSTWMQWKWALDHTVQVFWGIMWNHFCTLSTNQHVAMFGGGGGALVLSLRGKPQCLALFMLHHQPVWLVFWL